MPNSNRYVCIHGHFYQPPRENPWLEQVETQDSAAPYHDWNERITAQCYAPNGASRIVNKKNEIIRILNNYAHISFNFGPTLLSWLEQNAPRAYRMVQQGDRASQERFSGHGSAIAQVYNHIIMPLANRRDKITQIRWGIADFERRFGRKPEGMWLAETAADSETLELLADHGIRFTILAPHQCARIRPLGEKEAEWKETTADTLDTRHPYRIRFKTGRSIAVFFYDGPRSRAIAFEGLLNSGDFFAARLTEGFLPEDTPQMVHVATDGESYGHHHRHGEMALSYAAKLIEKMENVRLTNYGEFLEKFPPKFEAQIVEDTSWSCAHGVGRWKENCGCNMGGGNGTWNQEWRKPLREALDWLRDSLIPLTEKTAASLFNDVWKARDAYISVVLDRSTISITNFLEVYANHELSSEERITALKLMEMQRHALLMYTSCGWFFDEISGIETVQVIAYAARVLQLATEVFGQEGSKLARLEEKFIDILRTAKSNIPAQGDGAAIFQDRIKHMQVGLEQVAVHYGISSLFTSYPDEAELFCYTIRRLSYEVVTSGRGRLLFGQACITSQITLEPEHVIYAVVHFGDQNISAVVKKYDPTKKDNYAEFVQKARAAVIGADFPTLIRLFDQEFGGKTYPIQSLFVDEQRRIIKLILNSTISEVESSLIAIYEGHAALLQFLAQSGLPQPPALSLAASFAVNAGLRRALESDPIDALQVRAYRGLASADQITLDTTVLRYITDQKMKKVMVSLHADPLNASHLDIALLTARTLNELPFELNLWQAQNLWYDILKLAPRLEVTAEWQQKFNELGLQMKIRVDELVVEETEDADKVQPLVEHAGGSVAIA